MLHLVRQWNDFAFVYAAGRCWLDRVSPYDVEVWRSHWASIYPSFAGAAELQIQAPNFPFMYPPSWALLAAPLALLPWPAACRIWDALNVLAYLGILGLLLRLLGDHVGEVIAKPWVWIVIGVATFNSAVRYTFWDCGLCMLPTLGIVGAFWAVSRKRVGWLATFSFIAALKPQMGLLPLAYLSFTGGLRGILFGAYATIGISLVALAPLDIALLPGQWRNSYDLHMAMGFNELENFHSFSALLAFLGVGKTSLLSPVLITVSLGLLSWLRLRVPPAQRERVFDPLSQLAVVAALEVAFVPLHSYDLVLLTPVFFWAYAARAQRMTLVAVALAALASRTLGWGSRVGFRPLAACFSVSIAVLCVAAWYRANRTVLARAMGRSPAPVAAEAFSPIASPEVEERLDPLP